MATLVTGGTGFVGSNIVKTLAERGHEVVCLDLVEPHTMVQKYHASLSGQIRYVQGDILDIDGLRRVVSGNNITKIIHAAVFTATRPDIEVDRSRSIVDINVVGTTNLLEMARELSLDRFLYVSSGSVYGEGRGAQEVLNEDTVLYPRSLYAATKYTSELLTRRYGELHGFPTVSVRLSSPYGPMERVTGHRAVMSAPYECTGNVVRGEPIRVGERSLGRDYTYVADTAAGICTVLDAPALSYEVYNVTSGVLVTLGDMVSTLQQLRPTVQVIEEPSKEYGNLRPGANRGTMDATRLSQDLGFTASHDIRSGMEDYLLWRESLPFHD